MNKLETIFIHLPAYREPELVPTIKDALVQAKHPERLRFGICRQYKEEDGFDNVDEYRDDPRFRIIDIEHKEAQGLPYARNLINELIQEDDDYVLQLDSHHRFIENFDVELIEMHNGLEQKGYKPILAGYLPYYDPFNDPDGRTMEPWLQEFASFYPHGTIFIRPTGIPNWEEMTEPFPSRFLSGHFCFARTEWTREIKHDPFIYFSGEELNLTVRSFTHGYDMFHPHKLIIWHATMREERNGMLVWDDQHKRQEYHWTERQRNARAKIRQLLGIEDNGYDLTGFDIGSVRTVHDYEKYAGFDFKNHRVQRYTLQNQFPPNPYTNEDDWENGFAKSFYFLVDVHPHHLPAKDYNMILIAFDDENGEGVYQEFIDDERVSHFINNGTPIHYEAMHLVDRDPVKVVYWGHSEERGWAERVEIWLEDEELQ